MLVVVISGDPTDVLETVVLIAELCFHVIAGAGLPVAMHVNEAAIPSVSADEDCTESASFRTIGPVNLKKSFVAHQLAFSLQKKN